MPLQMSVIHWNAILINAEKPFACRYPSGGGRPRDVPDSGGTRYEVGPGGAGRQTLPSTSEDS